MLARLISSRGFDSASGQKDRGPWHQIDWWRHGARNGHISRARNQSRAYSALEEEMNIRLAP